MQNKLHRPFSSMLEDLSGVEKWCASRFKRVGMDNHSSFARCVNASITCSTVFHDAWKSPLDLKDCCALYFAHRPCQKNSKPFFRNPSRRWEEETRMSLSPLTMVRVVCCHVYIPSPYFCNPICFSSGSEVQQCCRRRSPLAHVTSVVDIVTRTYSRRTEHVLR